MNFFLDSLKKSGYKNIPVSLFRRFDVSLFSNAHITQVSMHVVAFALREGALF